MVALSLLLFPLLAEAQPQPPDVPTLGPALIMSAGDGFTNVTVYSPQNQSYQEKPIELTFSVDAVGMFGQFGNVGYQIDQGTIRSVTSFVNKTIGNESMPNWYYSRTTIFATIELTDLSLGPHNVTVYYGWQYLGIPENPSLERFEVYAYDSVEFTIADSNLSVTDYNTPSSTVTPMPTPTVAEHSIATITLLAALTVPAILILKRKRN